MKVLLALIVIAGTTASSLASNNSIQDENSVGLYFDESLENPCYNDTSSYPIIAVGKLVLKKCSEQGGVKSWEGEFDLSPTINLISFNLGQGAINTTQSPEFVVDTSTPFPQADEILLGEFIFYCAGPGEIFFHCAEHGRVTSTVRPVFFEGGDLDNIIEMSYSFGGPYDPIATIGDISCPEPLEKMPEQGFGQIAFSEGYLSNEDSRIKTGFTENHSLVRNPKLPDNLSDLWIDTSLGFSGTVVGFEKGCYEVDRSLAGLIKVKVEIEEIFWGPDLPVVEFWVEGVSVDQCIGYDDLLRFDAGENLKVGQKIAAFCNFSNGVFKSSKWRVFVPTQDKRTPLSSQEVVDLRRIGEINNFETFWKKSAVVAMLSFNNSYDNLGDKFTVRAVYKGRRLISESEEISVKLPYGYRAIVSSNRSSQPALFFLIKSQSGSFAPVSGRKSIFPIENGFATTSDGVFVNNFLEIGGQK